MRRRGDPGRRWLSFLENPREVIVAFDFFTVLTLTFQLLYLIRRHLIWHDQSIAETLVVSFAMIRGNEFADPRSQRSLTEEDHPIQAEFL